MLMEARHAEFVSDSSPVKTVRGDIYPLLLSVFDGKLVEKSSSYVPVLVRSKPERTCRARADLP